jgi:hypothetical protein
VHGCTSGLASSEKTLNSGIVVGAAIGVGGLADDLTVVVGGDATHVVVHSRQDWDGLYSKGVGLTPIGSPIENREIRETFCVQTPPITFGYINPSKNSGSLRDARKTFSKEFRGEVVEVEVNVVLVLADTSTVADLHRHGAGHDITRCEILGSGSISFHEPLTFTVAEDTTLTTAALSD